MMACSTPARRWSKMLLGASAPDGFASFVGTPHSGDRAVISPGVATPSFLLTMKAPSSVDGASSGVGGYDGDELLDVQPE